MINVCVCVCACVRACRNTLLCMSEIGTKRAVTRSQPVCKYHSVFLRDGWSLLFTAVFSKARLIRPEANLNSTQQSLSLFPLSLGLPLCGGDIYNKFNTKRFTCWPWCVKYWTSHKLLKENSVYEYTLKQTQEALWKKKWSVSPVARSSTLDLNFKCANFQFLGEKKHVPRSSLHTKRQNININCPRMHNINQSVLCVFWKKCSSVLIENLEKPWRVIGFFGFFLFFCLQ